MNNVSKPFGSRKYNNCVSKNILNHESRFFNILWNTIMKIVSNINGFFDEISCNIKWKY